MKKLLNTLYVTTQGTYIHKEGTNLVISLDGSNIGRLPVHNIQQIVCFGNVMMSPHAMALCAENNVSICFMSINGRYLASVQGPIRGNVLLRRSQYRIADDPGNSIMISKNMILGKMINCRRILSKGFRNHPEVSNSIGGHVLLTRLNDYVDTLDDASDSNGLRAIEGAFAKEYFRALDGLILKNKNMFFMKCRTRRPPKDRFNSLLSFLYTMQMNDVRSALESVGLDPYVGFLHTDRPGRPSLALDLMEELRPIADRLALRLINLGIISDIDFIEKEGGAILISDDARRIIIDAWQTRKNDTVPHPFLDESIQVGMIPFVQAMLLAKVIRGELGAYPPFIIEQ